MQITQDVHVLQMPFADNTKLDDSSDEAPWLHLQYGLMEQSIRNLLRKGSTTGS